MHLFSINLNFDISLTDIKSIRVVKLTYRYISHYYFTAIFRKRVVGQGHSPIRV